MKGNPTATPRTASSTVPLRIRTAATPADWQIAHGLLDEEHLLGAGREAGDRLCQFIVQEDEIVAVLVWCAAAWHLQDRDTMIGWDPVTRSQRLKLVVQLRRFLVPGKSRRPNLASQCLGLALRELPARCHAEHGNRPLLAESFSDPESHHGTVYKVTSWTCAPPSFKCPPPAKPPPPLSAMLTVVALGLPSRRRPTRRHDPRHQQKRRPRGERSLRPAHRPAGAP